MCGSGTTLVAAARLGRACVGGDASPVAIATTRARLERGVAFDLFDQGEAERTERTP